METKKLFPIVVMVAVGIALLLVLSDKSKDKTQPVSNSADEKGSAALYLEPSQSTVKVGQSLAVNIVLDTAGRPIDGVDIYAMHYDPSVLQVVDDMPSQKGIQVEAGSILPVVAANIVDTSGLIKLGFVTQGGGAVYNGKGVLATVHFKALKTGTVSLTFDFKVGSTTDTNVAYRGKDQLVKAIGASLVIEK